MRYNEQEIKRLAVRIRKNILRAIASKGTGHVGGSLSIADALAVLYGGMMDVDPKNPEKPDRDYLVLSKGHCGPAVYAALAARGYFEEGLLDTLNQNDTTLPSHTDRNKTPGVDMTTGSLGQGASLAAGTAFADKLSGRTSYTYLILGDGELDEGQVWEMALFAAHQGLDHLVALVDVNGKQLDGTTDEVCGLGSIEDKFQAFGFRVITVEHGNDTREIFEALEKARQGRGKPTAVILHTVKGAGIDFYASMENCHSTAVCQERLPEFYGELEQALLQERGKAG